MKLSVIIVPYKCKDELDVALEAVYKQITSYDYEVIIIDNDSQDGTVEMVKEKYLSQSELSVKTVLIENSNEGFGKANNRGMAMAKGDYILLLNPDTKLAPDNFQVMVDFMQSRKDVGMATCKLLKANGDLDWACRRSEPDPKIAFYRLSGLQFLFPKKFGTYNVMNKDINQETEVDCIVGAYMMISRDCYQTVRGFDTEFFMYGEDIDLCYRVRQGGFKIWYYPKTMSFHYKGKSSKKSSQKSLYAFHEAMILYYKKHYQKKYNSKFMDGFVYLGVWGRYCLKSLVNFFRTDKFVSR